MQKPTTFFSHSSQDKHALVQLKDLFVQKTGGSIDVFLSSDGQSIPFGRNWVHSVEQALDQAKLMLAFVTPSSVRSNWMYFETGYAYSKGVHVVPIGLGVDLSTVGAPLSLLQGFNITSEGGLNNIITVANQVFEHRHTITFSSDDFRLIANSTGVSSNGTLGPHVAAIDEIILHIKRFDLGSVDPVLALKTIANVFSHENIEHKQSEKLIKAQGMVFHAEVGGDFDGIRIELHPAVLDKSISLIERLVRSVHPSGMTDIPVQFEFTGLVDAVTQHHKQTGRLLDNGVRLSSDSDLEFKTLSFKIGRLMNYMFPKAKPSAVYLSIGSKNQSLALTEVRELLDLLFERGVLMFKDT